MTTRDDETFIITIHPDWLPETGYDVEAAALHSWHKGAELLVRLIENDDKTNALGLAKEMHRCIGAAIGGADD